METLSVAETAKIFGVGIHTMYRLVREGKIPALEIGARVRISRKVIDEILQSGKFPLQTVALDDSETHNGDGQ